MGLDSLDPFGSIFGKLSVLLYKQTVFYVAK